MSNLAKIIADFDTSITAKISVAGTTATLLSVLDDDGNTIPNGRYFITIDGDTSQKEHFSCTLTGTALTALKSINRQGTEASGAVREHRVGAVVVMTNFAHIKFLNDLLDGTTDWDGTVPFKYDIDPTLTDDKHIATKKYIDDIAIAGCSKATDANEGISKLSVAAASATDPIVVGDNDGRVPTQDENNALVGTHNTPSTSKPYVNNDLVVSHTANTVGNLVGGSGATSAFATWAAITDGSFRITVDGTAYNVDTVDFSGAGDMDAVAAILQVDLRVATSGTETVVWDTDHFVITSIQEDEDSEISVTTTSTGTVGTDLSGLGATAFMDCDAGTATQGTSDHDSVVKLDTDGQIEEEFIEKDTDGTLAADSDTKIASQKAVKTYVDTLDRYTPQAFLNYYDGNITDRSDNMNIVSNADGSIIIILSNQTSQMFIDRFEKDSETGFYNHTHTTDFSLGAALNSACGTIIGNYLFLYARNTAPINLVRRFDLADLANITTFTISGTETTNPFSAFTDGTDFYIFSTTSNFHRYTISGTVITRAATITYTSSDNVYGACADANYVYMRDTSAADVIRKYAFAGGAVVSTFGASRVNLGYPNVSTPRLTMCDVGVLYQVLGYSVDSATAMVGAVCQLNPRTII